MPSSYRVSEPAKVESLSPDVEVTLTQMVDVDGAGLRLKKYAVKSLVQDSVNLNEKLFLSSSVSQAIFAVAIEDHRLHTGRPTRCLWWIRRSNHNEPQEKVQQSGAKTEKDCHLGRHRGDLSGSGRHRLQIVQNR